MDQFFMCLKKKVFSFFYFNLAIPGGLAYVTDSLTICFYCDFETKKLLTT